MFYVKLMWYLRLLLTLFWMLHGVNSILSTQTGNQCYVMLAFV